MTHDEALDVLVENTLNLPDETLRRLEGIVTNKIQMMQTDRELEKYIGPRKRSAFCQLLCAREAFPAIALEHALKIMRENGEIP